MLPFGSIEISGYRSAGKSGFELKNLSRLNFLCGQNNSGKSNVLRAIQLLASLKHERLESVPSELTEIHRRSGAPLIATATVTLKNAIPKDGLTPRDMSNLEKAVGAVAEVR